MYDFLIGATFPAPQTVRLFVTIFGTSHTSIQALNSTYSHCSIRGLALLIRGELPMYLSATGTVPSTQHVLSASWADESSAQQTVGRGGLRRPLEGSLPTQGPKSQQLSCLKGQRLLQKLHLEEGGSEDLLKKGTRGPPLPSGAGLLFLLRVTCASLGGEGTVPAPQA